MGRSAIAEFCPGWTIDDRISESGWYHARDLETDEEAIERARAVAQWINTDLLEHWKAANDRRRVGLVIHADFKSLLLQQLFGSSNGRPACRESIG